MTNEEAIELLKYKRMEINYKVNGITQFSKALDLAIKALEQQPKTGHWIEEDMFDGEVAYRCSKCGGLFELENGTPKENEYNFCPKCGAKMAESENT